MTDVRGKLIRLTENRLVYVGTDRSGESLDYYIVFRSHAGVDTRLHLSPEAMGALREAMSDCHVGDDVFPHKVEWRVVEFARGDDQ